MNNEENRDKANLIEVVRTPKRYTDDIDELRSTRFGFHKRKDSFSMDLYIVYRIKIVQQMKLILHNQ